MKKLLSLLFIIAFSFVACDNPEPTEITKTSESNAPPSSEKKKPSNAPVPPLTYVTIPPADWNIQSDTSNCGTVHLTWNAQPNAAVYTIFDMTPRNLPCPALLSFTNELYYTLGPGCYWNAMHTYSVTVSYSWKDVGANIIYSYSSLPYSLTTGPIIFNCN